MDFVSKTFHFFTGLIDTVAHGIIGLTFLVIVAGMIWWLSSELLLNTKKQLINVSGFLSVFIVWFGIPFIVAKFLPFPDKPLAVIPLWIASMITGLYVSKKIFQLDRSDEV
ncbi:MAG: hypothetical protein ACQEXC_09655 [Pseudomonadota bacterium]